MAEKIRIDFVSDVVCPWCVIGLRSLQQALAAVGPEIDAEIHLHPFELNPDMEPEGENTAEHIQKKYGGGPERSAASRAMLQERGAEFGFAFNFTPDSRIWNTFDAHRLLYWAGLEGRALALKEALLKANFTDQLSVSDHTVLASLAREAGLDGDRAREILGTGAYVDEVRAEEDLWRRQGISAVPSVIINQRWLIQGGQPPEIFERALREFAAGRAA